MDSMIDAIETGWWDEDKVGDRRRHWPVGSELMFARHLDITRVSTYVQNHTNLCEPARDTDPRSVSACISSQANLM